MVARKAQFSLDFSADLLRYDTSGNVTGDYETSVSYASIIFSGKINMNNKKENRNSGFAQVDGFTQLPDEDKKFLLKLARDNIKSWLINKKEISVKPEEVPERADRLPHHYRQGHRRKSL